MVSKQFPSSIIEAQRLSPWPLPARDPQWLLEEAWLEAIFN